MKARFFLSLSVCLFYLPCWATEFISRDQLAGAVQTWSQATLTDYFAHSDQRSFEVTVANLDSRLKLPACTQPLQHQFATPYSPKVITASIKTRCTSPAWSLLIPIKIERQLNIAVAKLPLIKGQILTADQFEFKTYSNQQAGFGYLENAKSFIGLELKRPLRTGELLRLTHLKQTLAVRNGETVIIEAKMAAMSVTTQGRALKGGLIGDTVKVRNEASQRILDAKIVAPGRVLVAL